MKLLIRSVSVIAALLDNEPGRINYEDETNHHPVRTHPRRRVRRLAAWRACATFGRRNPEPDRLLPARRRRQLDLPGQTVSGRRRDLSPVAHAVRDRADENRREDRGQKADGRPREIFPPLSR